MSGPLRKITQVAGVVSGIFTWTCLKRKKSLQSPSTMLLHLSLQPGKPHSRSAFPHWSRVWSKCYWNRLTTPSWLGFCLSCLSSALHPPLAISSLGLRSLSLPAGSSALFPFPAPSFHNMSTFPWWMPAHISEQLYWKALFAPKQGRGCPGRGLMLLGNLFLLQQWFFLPVPADAGTTNDSNITEAVAPVAVYLLFMVIVVKGFVNISSLPSSVKTDIILYFCSVPA